MGHVRYNMFPRLSGQTSIFSIVFFVFRSLLVIERQKKLKRLTILTPEASEPCKNIDISNVAYSRKNLDTFA